jgi:hypothetical protein
MKIHEYPNESLSFQDADYYDIDFWNGSAFETKKILGSTIKAGIQAGMIDAATFAAGLATKFNVPTGTGAEYLDGTGAPQPFPAIPAPVAVTEISNSTPVSSASLLVWTSHMNFVPPAGVYLVLINLEAFNSNTNTTIHFGIGKNLVLEANTERRNAVQTLNKYLSCALSKYMTFNGTDTLNLLVRMSGGTTTTEGKSITLIKVA